MPLFETSRRLTEGDIAAVEELLARSAVDGQPTLSDQLRVDLAAGGADGFVAVLARDAADGQPVAYAQVSQGNDACSLGVVIDPDRRADAELLGSDLITAALAAVAADGGGLVDWWVTEPSPADHRLADRHGFRIDRRLHQMRRTLPTGRAVTITTRAYVPGADDDEWLAVNNRAFATHREQGGWTRETLRRRRAEPWFDAAGFRVHERDGRIAGFCWTKIHPPGSPGAEPVGEIYVIAVDPDFHGLGLGTQLTLAGLEHLHATGITNALLYVDAENTAAVMMYERLGFEVSATNVAFVRHVEPEAGA